MLAAMYRSRPLFLPGKLKHPTMSSTQQGKWLLLLSFSPPPLPLPPPPKLVAVAARSVPNRSLSVMPAVHLSFHPFPPMPLVPMPSITWYTATTPLLFCSVQLRANYSPFCPAPVLSRANFVSFRRMCQERYEEAQETMPQARIRAAKPDLSKPPTRRGR